MFYNTGHALSKLKVEERKAQKAVFPNQISVGSFTPHSTIVEVAGFRTDAVKAAIHSSNLIGVRGDLQVLLHELTHWFDFFGTLWGRKYSCAIAKAYRALERRTEAEFPRLVELFDLDRRILSPAYYRFTAPPAEPHDKNRPWSIDFACGAEIDAYGRMDERRPLFLVRFGENPSRNNFARQPISPGALLEVRAIASEMNAGISAIGTAREEGERIVEMAQFRREFESLVYNHELIEYNAAAHTLAIIAGSKDLVQTYRLAASLAFIALNMSEEDFSRIKVPERFKIFGRRNRVLLKNHDCGFAFICLVFNGAAFEGDENAYISNCLRQSNLDTAEAILMRAADALAEPMYLSNPSEITSHFMREAMMGGEICKRLASQECQLVTLENVIGDFRAIAPPFMDSEGDFIELNSGRIDEFQPEMMHDAAHLLRSYTRNLLTGCRGLD
ncbi:hypothetical protein [Agrobacterium tumefaciens]|nr:hypothetical protein [Agrobacterium tumefaciens]